MMTLEEGLAVRPTHDLVAERPELAGGRIGEVLRIEESEVVVVKWEGLPKPYRVTSSRLKAAEL